MRPTKALLLALSLLIALTAIQAKKLLQLTDATFEHDTQASTGSTTGDWFVSFCDRVKDKQHCMATDAVWTRVAESLNRRVSVAQVDT